jgi:hypothetical protein
VAAGQRPERAGREELDGETGAWGLGPEFRLVPGVTRERVSRMVDVRRLLLCHAQHRGQTGVSWQHSLPLNRNPVSQTSCHPAQLWCGNRAICNS